MSQVYIMGFVGCGNLGDEAILAGNLHALQSAGVTDPVVFSWQPDQTAKEHKVCALPVLPGISGLRDFASRLKRGDLFILGGGSLLQDGQRRIVPFWLSRALCAKLRGCTVVFHAQGVGPLTTGLGRSLVKSLVPVTASVFTVRDKDSLKLVPPRVPTSLVADPALLLPPIVTTRQDYIAVALRNTKFDKQLQAVAQELKETAARLGLNLLYIPMHHPDDLAVNTEIAHLTGGKIYEGPHTVDGVRQALAAAEVVVAMRLHAAILASGLGIPSVGLSYDPKVRSFYDELGLSKCALSWDESFSTEAFKQTLLTVCAKRKTLSQNIIDAVDNLRLRAQQSIPLALAAWRKRSEQ